MVHATGFCLLATLLYSQYFNHINVYLETGVITSRTPPGFSTVRVPNAGEGMRWVPTNQPRFVSLIQLPYRQAAIFRRGLISFHSGWLADSNNRARGEHRQRRRQGSQKKGCEEAKVSLELDSLSHLELKGQSISQSRGRRRAVAG